MFFLCVFKELWLCTEITNECASKEQHKQMGVNDKQKSCKYLENKSEYMLRTYFVNRFGWEWVYTGTLPHNRQKRAL